MPITSPSHMSTPSINATNDKTAIIFATIPKTIEMADIAPLVAASNPLEASLKNKLIYKKITSDKNFF